MATRLADPSLLELGHGGHPCCPKGRDSSSADFGARAGRPALWCRPDTECERDAPGGRCMLLRPELVIELAVLATRLVRRGVLHGAAVAAARALQVRASAQSDCHVPAPTTARTTPLVRILLELAAPLCAGSSRPSRDGTGPMLNVRTSIRSWALLATLAIWPAEHRRALAAGRRTAPG